MSDNPAKIAELQNDKLVELLRSKSLGPPVCRHIESKGHNGQQFVKPEYVIDTFPSVVFLKSIKIIRAQIRTLVSIRKELNVETSTVPYIEIHNNATAAAAASAAQQQQKEFIPTPETMPGLVSAEKNEGTFNSYFAKLCTGVLDTMRTANDNTVRVHARTLQEEENVMGAQQHCEQQSQQELHVETSTVPYLEINSNSNNNDSAAAASSSPSTTTTTLTAEEAEKTLQEPAPLFTTSKYSEAIELYSKVVDNISLNEADPSLKQILSRALSNRSGCFLGLKKSKEALEDGRRCVDVRPSWVRAHLRLAAAAEELGEVDLAISAYQAAIKAEDRSGTPIPSQQELEKSILSVQRKQFVFLMINGSDVSPASARDTLISAVKYCTSAELAESFCGSIGDLTDGNTAIIFGTSSVRDAIVAVSKYCTTAHSAYSFCRSIGNLAANDNNRILFGTASVRDSMLTMSKHCVDTDSAFSFCLSIISLTKNDSNRILFGTVSVRDALLLVSKYCTSTNTAAYFCLAIKNIIYQNESNAVLFATEAIRDAILSVSAYIDYCIGVCTCCRVISLFHETKPTLFCVEETVTSLVRLSKVEIEKQSAESIYWFLNVVLTLLHSDKKLFDTAEIRNAVERFQKVVNDPEEVENLENETFDVDALSNEEYIIKSRQLCVEFQKVVSEKSEASSSAAADADAAAASLFQEFFPL